MTKLKNAFTCLLMLTVGVSLFSCSNDDDPETPTPTVEKTAKEVVGTYNGYHKMVATYFPEGMYADGETITITESTDTTVTIVYNADGWESTLTDVVVKKADDGYTLTGEGKMNMTGMSGQKSEYDCLLSGTVSKDKSAYTFTYTLPAVMRGTTITFINGEAPAANMVADTYVGYHEMSSKYFSGMYGINDTIKVKANEDGTASVTFNSDSWETTITGVTVVSEGDNYTLTGEGTMSMAGMSGQKSDYACQLSGTISKDKSACSLVFTLPSVMGGTTIAFSNGEVPVAKYLAGDYTGWSKFVFKYMPNGMNYDAQTVKLTANEDGTATITYTSTDLGNSEIVVTITKGDDGSYQLSGEGEFNMGMSGSEAKAYACTVEGTISSDKATYSIVFTLPSVMGGSTITFQNGSAPATEE